VTEEKKTNRRARYDLTEVVPERKIMPLGDQTTDFIKLRKLILFEMHSASVFLEQHGCVLTYGGTDCRFKISDRFYK
jgi:hypothetical protein